MPTPPTRAVASFDAPYRRSWVEAFVAVVDRLPGPAWVPYCVVTLLFVVTGTALRWVDGTLAVGEFSAPRFAIDVVAIYGLAAIHFAKWVAAASLNTFAPALGELAAHRELVLYRLTTFPRGTGVISIVVGVTLAILSLMETPRAWDITPTTPPAVATFFVVEAVLMMSFFVTFLFFVYRQLVTVVRIHRDATNVRIFESTAHSGFSMLTLSSSVSVALPIYIGAASYAIAGQFMVGVSVVDGAMMATVLVTAALVFVVPLYGMHRRLVRIKALALDAVGRSFEATTVDLHQRIAARDFEGLGGLNTALSSLTAERDAIRQATTWPWEAQTLRGFVSSILLPVVIWLTTTLLSRVLT